MDELTPLASDPPFLYADIEPTVGSLPARYTGPLPRDAKGWCGPSAPPAWYVEDRLRAGDPDMVARLDDAFASLTAWDEALAIHYARTLARTLDSPAVGAWFATYLARATTASDLRRDVLSAVVLERRFVFPRGTDEANAAWDAAEVHLDALVERFEVTREASDAWRARRHPAPPEAEPAPSDAPDFFAPLPLDAFDLRDANRAVRLRVGAAKDILAADPDRIVEVAVALECMAFDRAVYPFERRRALLELVEIDHAHAVTVANGERHAVLEPVAALLRRFANVGELAAYFAAVGLLEDPEAVAPTDPRQWALKSLLWKRTETFETKTGYFPNEHDHQLYRLAKLAKGALSDVVFEERPPRDPDADEPDPDAPEGAYVLRAYAEGKVWEIRAEESNHYDVDGMLGLLNIVARHLGRDVRFLFLPFDEPGACVLGGPLAAIERAVNDRVLITYAPPTID